MNDYVLNNLENRISKLEKKVNLNTFIWLIILSNLVFWLFISSSSLRKDVNTIKKGVPLNQLTKNTNISHQKNENRYNKDCKS